VAGLIVVLMQTGGEALERYAEGRASQAVRELEAAAPRLAHRLGAGGLVEDVDAEAVVVGDELLVRPGELVPCDGVVLTGRSHVDAARLTGEPVPVSATAGVALLRGSLNIEGPLTLSTTAPASESQYAKIVELVRTAQESKSPLQRLADRYAVWFTPFTLLVCAAAWLVTRDPVRVLAVLVVATPCPLILATPVAVVGGISRAARRGSSSAMAPPSSSSAASAWRSSTRPGRSPSAGRWCRTYTRPRRSRRRRCFVWPARWSTAPATCWRAR
jgi:P-type E1-E2 ATPase